MFKLGPVATNLNEVKCKNVFVLMVRQRIKVGELVHKASWIMLAVLLVLALNLPSTLSQHVKTQQ